MIIPQNTKILRIKCTFWENSVRKHSETSWLTQRHNALVYDVTNKEARNWRKLCYVTFVFSDKFMKLWNGFLSSDKWLYASIS